MKINYDKESDSKYVKFGTVGKTVTTKKIQDWLFVDCDNHDNIVGAEILDSSKHPVAFVLDGQDNVKYIQVSEIEPINNKDRMDGSSIPSIYLDVEKAMELA